MKYFIYTRKSTENEDRQVLSIESQLAELREFAAKEKLEIVGPTFVETKTAKEPEKYRLELYFNFGKRKFFHKEFLCLIMLGYFLHSLR